MKRFACLALAMGLMVGCEKAADVPTAVKNPADAMKKVEEAGTKAGEAVDAAKDAATGAVDAAKDAATGAVDAAGAKAGEAVDAAKDAATEPKKE